MNTLAASLRILPLLPLSIALVLACGSSSSSDDGQDGGASSSSGASGSSGSSGASGSSGSSGSDGSTTDAPVSPAEPPCDPAKNDCKPGEVCTDVGRATPVCRAGCKNDGECAGAPKGGCVLLTPGTPDTGACIPTCTPYGTDCAAGSTCSRAPEQVSVTQTSKATFCKKTGATPLGGSCVNDPGSCGANADCIFFPAPPQNESVADSKCHTLCDPTHPCGAGKGSCFTKTGDSFGFCNGG